MFDVFMTSCMTCMHYAPINRRILLHQENGHVYQIYPQFLCIQVQD